MTLPKKIKKLEEFHAPTVFDELFLNNFKTLPDSKKIDKIIKITNERDYNFIVRLAALDADFKKICKLPQLANNWSEAWCEMGRLLAHSNEISFFPQPEQNQFNLFAGAVYFYLSQIIMDKIRHDQYSAIEMAYVRYALKFESIHAAQRFNDYLFFQSRQENNNNKIQGLLQQAIKNSKFFVEHYGKYAYVMVANCFIRYAIFMHKIGNHEEKEKAINSAKIAWQHANDPQLSNQSHIIFNASINGAIPLINDAQELLAEGIDNLLMKVLNIVETPSASMPTMIHNSP